MVASSVVPKECPSPLNLSPRWELEFREESWDRKSSGWSEGEVRIQKLP